MKKKPRTNATSPIEMTLGVVHPLIVRAVDRWLEDGEGQSIEDLVLVIEVNSNGKARVTATDRESYGGVISTREELSSEIRARVPECTPALFDFDDGKKHFQVVAWLRLSEQGIEPEDAPS